MSRLRVMAVLAMVVVVAGCPPPGAREEVEQVAIGTEAEEPGRTGVGFELAGPGEAALLVPVFVNGQGPYSFVLDTGATMTCVDMVVAEELELPTEPGRIGIGMGIEQEPGGLELVSIDSLRVGNATAMGLTGCALDLGRFRAMGLEVEGLLGLNFLREFRVTLDFRTEELTLER